MNIPSSILDRTHSLKKLDGLDMIPETTISYTCSIDVNCFQSRIHYNEGLLALDTAMENDEDNLLI